MKNPKLQSLALVLTTALSITTLNTGWTNHDSFDEISNSLEKSIDKFEENLEAIQEYLNNYEWEALVPDKATSGAATLRYLKLNNYPKAVVVKPGETVKGLVECDLDWDETSSLDVYRIVLGIKGEGAKVAIGTELGITAGKISENFTLIAPLKPGIYQIRFRLVKELFETTALGEWLDEKGNEPDAHTTIGIIVVKE
jgi:hypothetical protein